MNHIEREKHERRADSGQHRRVIAIGDIHGCSVALQGVLESIAPRPEDTLVILGDFIDRGPDSRGVIERLLELQGECRLVSLLGNHEEMFLAAREGQSDFRYWNGFGGSEMLESYSLRDCREVPRAHLNFIRNCQPFYETDTHIFVHAGVAPNFPMDEQSSLDLLWRPLHPSDAAMHYSGKTIVCGHSPQPDGRILDLGFLKCVDTFCHAGGWLTALEVNSGQIWQANQAGERRYDQSGEAYGFVGDPGKADSRGSRRRPNRRRRRARADRPLDGDAP